jgi:hypothetical protein
MDWKVWQQGGFLCYESSILLHCFQSDSVIFEFQILLSPRTYLSIDLLARQQKTNEQSN